MQLERAFTHPCRLMKHVKISLNPTVGTCFLKGMYQDCAHTPTKLRSLALLSLFSGEKHNKINDTNCFTIQDRSSALCYNSHSANYQCRWK